MQAEPQDLSLTVYVDAECGLCRRVWAWLDKQPQYVPIYCRPAQAESSKSCPINPDTVLNEVTVIASDGAVYRGTKAWIICLWALVNYRAWSLRLADPSMLPWARRLFGIVVRFGKVTRRDQAPSPQDPQG